MTLLDTKPMVDGNTPQIILDGEVMKLGDPYQEENQLLEMIMM